MTRRKRRFWTDAERDLLRRLYPDTPTAEIAEQLGLPVEKVYSQAARLNLKKSAAYLASPAACRLRRGDNVGEATRFKKGCAPWNKGTNFKAGGRSVETRFKKGSRPQTWVPVGTDVVDRDGYRKRKIRDDAPPGQSRFNWAFVHVLIWTEHHGPVPKGHVVAFRNGDRADLRIENLECVSRAELAHRNTIARFPPELQSAIQLTHRLRRRIQRREEQDRGPEESPVHGPGGAQ